MLGTSLFTLTDFIPNTYVVREYSDKHLIQRRMGWVNGSVELTEIENLIVNLVVKIVNVYSI